MVIITFVKFQISPADLSWHFQTDSLKGLLRQISLVHWAIILFFLLAQDQNLIDLFTDTAAILNLLD